MVCTDALSVRPTVENVENALQTVGICRSFTETKTPQYVIFLLEFPSECGLKTLIDAFSE